MKIIQTGTLEYRKVIEQFEKRKILTENEKLLTRVKKIIKEVKLNRDAGLLKCIRLYEGKICRGEDLRITQEEINRACKKISKEELSTLKYGAKRITDFHQRQFKEREKSWLKREKGIYCGQIIRPLERVGVYVPGGKASYPSSVLMGVIPARIAGVKEIIVCTPSGKGEDNPYTLAAAHIAGADKIYRAGGAQAVAAMAYGTSLIPRVDKIVGPGNIYVTLAKKLLFGIVDIDLLAGPTEIVIIADKTAPPDFIAADLISQAEHDEQAVPILITTSLALAQKVIACLPGQLENLARKKIIKRSLQRKGKIFLVKNLAEAINLADRLAPEHLEIALKDPQKIYPRIKNTGAIFLGQYTPQALGDYLAGSNHILPTTGTARFASPLGVYDFIKRTNIISASKDSLQSWEREIMLFSSMEGLTAHGEALKIRIKN